MTKNKEAYNKSVHFLKLFQEGYFKKHPNQLELQNLKKELISFVELEDFLALLKTRKFREEKAKIDWGYAKDYVETAHKIMQRAKPDIFVIATGKSYTVKNFVEEAFKYIGR